MAKENLDIILSKIEKHLSYSNKLIKVLESLDKKIGGTGTKNEIDKSREEVEKFGKSIKESKKYVDDFTKSSKNMKNFGETLKDAIPRLKDFVKNSFNVGRSLMSFDTNLSKIGHSLQGLTSYGSKLSVFTSVMGSSLDLLQRYVDILKAVSLSTVKFEDGMSGIIIAASKAGMTLENYAKFLENYSGAINRYGLPSTLRMIEGLRSNAKELYMMGLSVSEVNDYFGTFLEQQRIFDNRRIRTESELQNMFKEQMKMTYDMAYTTGRSFSEVFKSITEKFRDPRTAAILQLLTEKSRKEFLKFVEMFPSLENIMLTSVQKGAIQFSDEFVNYATSVMPELVKISEGLKIGTIDAETAYRILRDSVKNISEDQMRLFALQGENVHTAVSRLIVEVNKINEQFERVNKQGEIDGISAALLQIENSMTYFSSQLRTKFLKMLIGEKTPEEIEEAFVRGKEKISNAMDYFMKAIEKLLESLSGESLGKGKSGLELLMDLLSKLIVSVSDVVVWLAKPENMNLIKGFFSGLFSLFSNIIEFVKENPILSLTGAAIFTKTVKPFLKFLTRGLWDLGKGVFDVVSERFSFKKLLQMKRKSESRKSSFENIDKDSGGKKGSGKTDIETTSKKSSTSVKGKLVGGLKSILRMGKFTIPGLLLGAGTEAATSAMEEGETKEATKSILGGASIGATIGGLLGSAVPLVGTAAGTLFGGAVGGLMGASDLIKKNFIDKIEEINKDIQDITLPPSASLERSYEELKNINKGISNIERQLAELNKFSRENTIISGAILRENKESNEKIGNYIGTTFYDNMA